MRDLFLRAMLVGVVVVGWAACGSAGGQMHKVAKPEQVVRAVGVYEWTGDMTKPTASRLIPVSIFIEGKLEDAGVYVARPVPFALLSGNVYELQDAGVDKAMLDLAFARHLQAENATGDLAYDDGWFGYGSVKPLAVAKLKPASKLKPSKTLPVLMSSTGATTKPDAGAGVGTTSASTDDPDRPTMKRRSDSSGTTAGGTDTTAGTTSTTPAAGSTPADDPDRPTMKRSDSSGSTAGGTDTTGGTSSTTASTAGSAPADDPDRPTMKRRTSDSSDSAGDSTTASSTGSGGTPADDPDRPTLKRHSAEDAKKAQNSGSDLATASGTGSLNDDPDRPSLHHGKPTSAMTETELPKLVGMPVDLHQMVAVSDAVNRDPHEFTLAFDDATQRAAVLQKMQAMARVQLAAYKGVPAPGAAAPAVAKVTATTAAKSRRAAAPAAAPVALMDEELKAYTLSYGGAATYVYSAHTAGTGSALRYVTIVAQADGLGELKPAIQSVTDAAHLDRAPRMRFVDVVDVEASNRASLLFELRGQNARQFGLYRVIAAHSEQIFLTGTTQ
jgi:hypothetical protein